VTAIVPLRRRSAAGFGSDEPQLIGDADELMYGIGNLCAGASGDSRYDARRMVKLPIAGLLQPPPASR
jgi:hypothetical protein